MMIAKKRVDLMAMLIAVLPIIRYFRSPISGFDNLGMVVLTIILFYALVRAPKRIAQGRIILIIYCAYIVVTYLVLSLFENGGSSGMGTLAYNTLILLILVSLYNCQTVFVIDNMLSTIRIVSLAACFVLGLQYISHYVFGGFVVVFPITFYTEQLSTGFASHMRITTGMSGGAFRPASFFNEPAHFAAYVSVAMIIAIYFFLKNKKYKYFGEILIYSVAILMTTSGIGFISVALGWGLLILHYLRFDARLNFKRFMLAIVVIIAVVIVFNQNFAQYGLARLFANGTTVYDRRSGGYGYFSELNIWDKIFGIGMGREPFNDYYFTTLSTMLTRTGLLGIVIYAMAIIRNWRNNQSFILWIDILYLIIIVMAGVDDFTNVAFYSMLIFANYKNVFVSEKDERGMVCG